MEESLSEDSIQEMLEELEEEQQSGQEPLSPDVEELLRELQSGRYSYTRSKAAEQLGRVDTSSPRIVQALLAACETDAHSLVREAAAKALSTPVHQEYLQEHPDLIERAEPDFEQAAAHRKKQRALEELEEEQQSGQEPLSPDVEELLRELESGRSAYTRSKAAEQLGRVDTSSPRIVQALLVARKADSHTVVRDAAARALLASAHQAVLQEHPD